MTPLPDFHLSPAAPAPRTAEDICGLFALSPPARLLLEAGMSPRQFFQRLVESNCLADARRLLAHTLRPEAAIWWATLCLEQSRSTRSFPESTEEEAFAAVGRWLVAPSETTRRMAETAAVRVGPTQAAGILASAVFLSGGSISRPGLPGVYPARHLCGRLCGVVVYLASVRCHPAQYKHLLRQYLQLGLEVACGENPPPVFLPEIPLAEPRERTPAIGMNEFPPAVRTLLETGLISREGLNAELLFHRPVPDNTRTEGQS